MPANSVVYKDILGKKVPFSDLYEHRDIDPRANREFAMQSAIDTFYFDTFFMLKMNKIEGDYLEFGSGSNVRSFRFALKYNRLEAFGDRMLYSFDSFEGLPEPVGIDTHEQWKQGAMAVSLEQFTEILAQYDAHAGTDYKTVKGFYNDTLDGAKPAERGITRAAFVHIDCDLYESTKSALNYVTDILQDGAILSFDDWFCFNGDPDKGEQRAFREWADQHKDVLGFLPYAKFGWHGMSFIVQRLDQK